MVERDISPMFTLLQNIQLLCRPLKLHNPTLGRHIDEDEIAEALLRSNLFPSYNKPVDLMGRVRKLLKFVVRYLVSPYDAYEDHG